MRWEPSSCRDFSAAGPAYRPPAGAVKLNGLERSVENQNGFPPLEPPAASSGLTVGRPRAYTVLDMMLFSPSGWDNFSAILTKPDNIPIVIMVALVSFFTWMSLSEAKKNDKLIEEGRRNEILRRMQD
jgi:hypothetical protein